MFSNNRSSTIAPLVQRSGIRLNVLMLAVKFRPLAVRVTVMFTGPDSGGKRPRGMDSGATILAA